MKSRLRTYSIFYLLLVVCASCVQQSSQIENGGEEYPIHYAKGFRVVKHATYTDVIIRDPWDTARVMRRYALVSRDLDTIPPIPKDAILVRTPLQKVVVYTAVQCGVLQELGVSGTIKGVCEPQYITVQDVVDGVTRGDVLNVGEASAPDVEKIIELNPEAIFSSPLKNIGYGSIEKMGIPIIECADYMENTPLGGAEWIRLMGLFYGKEAKADSLFTSTLNNYEAAKEIVAGVTYRPTVLTEMKTSSTWYVSGGHSFMAHLLRDAGAKYIWEEDESTAALAMAFETVFEKGQHADFWILKYNAPQDMTLRDLKKRYELNARFDAFVQRKVYACNAGRVNYYDKLLLHPDRVLTDFISIFHPQLMSGYESYYYKKMEP